jgi:hypothetical protein
MANDFDIFETLPDRSVKWRVCVRGGEAALTSLVRISMQTVNEVFAIDLATQRIIGRINEGSHARTSDTSPKMDQLRLTND